MSAKKTFATVVGLLFAISAGCVAPPPDGNGNDNVNDNINDNGNGGEPAATLFKTSPTCAFCHNGLTDEADNDVSIETAWKATMMANAARDPYYLAKVTAEIARAPALKETLEDTCATCHMPMAHTQATADNTSTAMFEDGFLNVANALHAEAIDGVSCTFCHQIEDVGLGEESSFSGNFTIELETEIPNRVNYGPYSDPDQEAMRATCGYIPVLGEHIEEAAVCAACHTLFTPYLDSEGNIAGQFPEQVTFFEWMHSDFGDGVGEDTTCQGCHMPEVDGGVVIAGAPTGLAPRTPFAQHHFVGGNAFMVEMLKANAGDLEVAASEGNFDVVIARTLAQLQGATADLTILSAEAAGDVLTVDVRVENKAGHKFPTGFPARRVWIHLAVTDGSGAMVFESGAPQADGSIVGCDSDEDASTFEPHYTMITDQNQIQIYQPVLQTTAGEVTQTLLKGAAYIKDNRLLPAGFDKPTASADFATVGRALEDADFAGGSDRLSYSVDVSGHEGPFRVNAELLYQSIAFPFVEDLREEDAPITAQFVGFFDAADKTPTLVASAEMVAAAH